MGGGREFRGGGKKKTEALDDFSCQSWSPKQPKESIRTLDIQWNSGKAPKEKGVYGRGWEGEIRKLKVISLQFTLDLGFLNNPTSTLHSPTLYTHLISTAALKKKKTFLIG